tara:strand:- start:30 stop:491 length:462 start_codon:yes stop_codon:yes gene_type:complete
VAIDAKYEDAYSNPIRLRALDLEDLQVISTLCQDSIVLGPDISWESSKRRLAILLHRFRWEESYDEPERVRSLLLFKDVKKVSSKSLSRTDVNKIYSLLSLKFEYEDNISGKFTLTFSDQAYILVAAECLDVNLQDVTRPYKAPSKTKPKHEE